MTVKDTDASTTRANSLVNPPSKSIRTVAVHAPVAEISDSSITGATAPSKGHVSRVENLKVLLATRTRVLEDLLLRKRKSEATLRRIITKRTVLSRRTTSPRNLDQSIGRP